MAESMNHELSVDVSAYRDEPRAIGKPSALGTLVVDGRMVQFCVTEIIGADIMEDGNTIFVSSKLPLNGPNDSSIVEQPTQTQKIKEYLRGSPLPTYEQLSLWELRKESEETLSLSENKLLI